jgi:hypothetical protein
MKRKQQSGAFIIHKRRLTTAPHGPAMPPAHTAVHGPRSPNETQHETSAAEILLCALDGATPEPSATRLNCI